MQVIYAPYNVYRWCVSKGLLPESSVLVFGKVGNDISKEIETEEDNSDETRVVVDLFASEERQAFQVLAGVAVYNLLAGGNCGEENIHAAAEDRAALYLQQWTSETNEIQLENCAALLSDVIHPSIVLLKILEEKQILESQEVVVLGELVISESEDAPLKTSTFWCQIKNILSLLSEEDRLVVVKEFEARWKDLAQKHTGVYVVLPTIEKGQLLSFCNTKETAFKGMAC